MLLSLSLSGKLNVAYTFLAGREMWRLVIAYKVTILYYSQAFQRGRVRDI